MLRRFGQTAASGVQATQGTRAVQPHWVDLLSPSRDEEAQVESDLGIDVPTHEDIRRIEPSSRLYREDGAVFAAAQIVVRGDTVHPGTTSVAFILQNNTLLTIRYEESRIFDLFAADCERVTGAVRSGAHGMVGLLEAIVDRTSEILEKVGIALDGLPAKIHPTKDGASKRRDIAELEEVLAEIQSLQRRTAKARESLVSLGRMVGFLMVQPEFKGQELRTRAKSVARDILSLTDHATFVAQNIQFVLDAALGIVGIEQNAIVKFFSIVAVVLLPPSLIAGIYGMNFQFMPELSWQWGYPLSISTMLASAVLPYIWCRRRGWL